MNSDIKYKGQVFSSDFLVGVLVFFFAITAVQVYQSGIVQKIDHQQDLIYREALISRTDTLVMFSEPPSKWNTTTIGLSTGEPNHINETRLRYFIQMDMGNVKELLGFRGKDFYFVIKNTTGSVLSGDGIEYEKGSRDWEDAEDVYTIKRNVFLVEQGEISNMRLVVW